MNPPAVTAPPPSPATTTTAPFISVLALDTAAGRNPTRFFEALELQTIGKDQFEVIVVTTDSARSADQRVDRSHLPGYVTCTAEKLTTALARGVQLAGGSLLAFTSTAGVPSRTWLGASRRAWREAENCAGVLGRIELLRPHLRSPVVTEIYDDQWTSAKYPRPPITRDGAINLLLPRSTYDLAGRLPVAESEIALHDWWRRATNHGFRIIRSPVPVVRMLYSRLE